jgi:hypothetical protein
MISKSRLILQKFMVFAKGSVIYSQEFHDGLNVIRGDHSVGKSTLIDLIFYALGGEIRKDQWVHPADKCDAVCAEISVNGKIFCLKRDIEVGAVPKIDVIEGAFEKISNLVVGWQSYGPRRSDSKVSFSQLMFDLLGWEASKTDDYANLTMHQILRLLYADQETPANKIFRAEPPNADSELTRLAVAEFLLSLDDLELYRAKQDLLIAGRSFDRINAELSAILQILGKDATYTVDQLNFEIANVLQDIEQLRIKRPSSVAVDVAGIEDSGSSPEIEQLAIEIEELSANIFEKDKDLSLYSAEISDCIAFAASLANRKKSLLESKATYEAIGAVEFKRCPCCNERIDAPINDATCPLCKVERAEDERSGMYLQVLAELEFQEKQNEKLLARLRIKLETEGTEKLVATEKLNVKRKMLKSLLGATSRRESELLEASRKLGFSESQAEHLGEKITIIQKLDDLRKSKLESVEIISNLQERILLLTENSDGRRNRVLGGIGNRALQILELDEEYEEVFASATKKEAEIDFGKDRWLVDGRVKFSGSSNFFKKNALHVAILAYALLDKTCRHPRFLMLDDIENGGMKPSRSQNFQRILANVVRGNEDKCQIIIATAMVDPSLDNEIFGIGPSYAKGDYVLKA